VSLQDACGALQGRGAGAFIVAVSLSLRNDKGVGANHRTQVMLQARIQPPLVLAQAELLLGFLVHRLCAPAFLEHVDQPFARCILRQAAQVRAVALSGAVSTLDDQPQRLVEMGMRTGKNAKRACSVFLVPSRHAYRRKGRAPTRAKSASTEPTACSLRTSCTFVLS
jgi:hypothetical protein